jgi:hypothetical protein
MLARASDSDSDRASAGASASEIARHDEQRHPPRGPREHDCSSTATRRPRLRHGTGYAISTGGYPSGPPTIPPRTACAVGPRLSSPAIRSITGYPFRARPRTSYTCLHAPLGRHRHCSFVPTTLAPTKPGDLPLLLCQGSLPCVDASPSVPVAAGPPENHSSGAPSRAPLQVVPCSLHLHPTYRSRDGTAPS